MCQWFFKCSQERWWRQGWGNREGKNKQGYDLRWSPSLSQIRGALGHTSTASTLSLLESRGVDFHIYTCQSLAKLPWCRDRARGRYGKAKLPGTSSSLCLGKVVPVAQGYSFEESHRKPLEMKECISCGRDGIVGGGQWPLQRVLE